MASGVKVSDEVINAYNAMKLKKANRYMTMVINDGYICIQKEVPRANSATQEHEFEEFLKALPSDDCLYALLDLNIIGKSGASKPTLFLITWCPDSSKTKDKMTYASSKEALMQKIREGTKALQANDISDLVYHELMGMA